MKYTKEELEKAVIESKSFTNLIKDILKLNYTTHYRSVIKAYIIKYGISISHWDNIYDKKSNLDYSKCYNKKLNSGTLRNLAFKFYKKPYICEKCNCNGVWLDEKITLEVHHIDGNRDNNLSENLQILCPNCHSQTDSHKKRKYTENYTRSNKVNKLQQKHKLFEKPSKQHKCLDCDDLVFAKRIKRCADCANKAQRTVVRPSKEQLMIDLKELPITKVGVKYGVTDNSIRNWAKKYQIELITKKK